MWDGCNSKTLLRLAMARIKLFRNKREIQVKQLRKEISQLLASGQEPSARIRVS
jgi:vacuolar protein sorting-associated protein IST1